MGMFVILPKLQVSVAVDLAMTFAPIASLEKNVRQNASCNAITQSSVTKFVTTLLGIVMANA
jgi:hypothetical protein